MSTGGDVRSRVAVVALRVLFVASAAVALGATTLLGAPEGHTIDGPAGDAHVSITPNEWLTDGQEVTVHAEAGPGKEIFEIRAHVCQPDAGVNNSFEFSFDGPYCAATPTSPAADAETRVLLEPGSRSSGDLTFRVGTGEASWVTHSPIDPPDGTVRSVRCATGAPCALVVQLQVTGGQAYFTAALLFGEGTTPPPPPPAAPSAGTPGASAAASEEAPALPAGRDTTPSQTPKPKGAAASALGDGASDASGSSSEGAQVAQSQSLGPTSLAVSREVATRGIRVFTGGLAGLLGGALIAYIVVRARSRTSQTRMA